jgi:hypothetical protein
MSMSRNLLDDILHVELGPLDYAPWLGQVVDSVEFYTKSSQFDFTRRPIIGLFTDITRQSFCP